MRQMIGKLGIALFAALFVAGCSSNREPQLMHLRSDSAGPDEFGILPTKPLQMPDNLSELPAPLYEAARLRLAHPDATLQELADLAEIGKSGMNHRLARLMRLAAELTP